MAFKLSISKRGNIDSAAEAIAEEIRAAKARGQTCYFLNVGAPASSAPDEAIDAAVKAEKSMKLGYSPTAGIPELRQRISAMYRDEYQLNIDPDRIIITIGASAAFFISFDSFFDVGDKIAVPVPCYNAYLDVMNSLGLDIVHFPALAEHHFQPSVDDLNQLGDIRGLLITNPGNPTGAMLSPERLKAIVDWCISKKVTLICDEIYHHLIYGNVPQESGLKFSDQIIVINSFSKYYSMPGWRLGWMVVPDQVIDSVLGLAHSLFIAPPSPSQYAALHAMDCKQDLDKHLDRYRRNRDILLAEMPKAGFDKFTPMDGAFYMYAHVKHLHEDSMAFCKQMIRETGVAGAPGLGFDPINGHHYMRFSYAGPTDEIKQAVEALKAWKRT